MTPRAWTLLGLCAGMLFNAWMWRAENTDLPPGYTGCIDICGDRDIIPLNDAEGMAQSHPIQSDAGAVQ
jgi:hypothetical protein